MSRPPRVGDVYVAASCTAADWSMRRDVEFVVERATRLGCGCWRVETTRPGTGPLAGAMHDMVNRCDFHARNAPAGYGSEPTRVVDDLEA